ncbi:type II secretion system protein [Veronia pacifica]|uniref:Uncharacterized protein n=1 Tax=Veronia pacifica TaxID=1080227 RepID=A0A1C3EQ24_9GAMM|nr:prepilin-type N-terminal cleavage/methylation domain-containing protein [Veronia pacifica]ODA35353.1 hypothetical protein A8L45_04095 [Veronia pacifica]
MISEQLDCVDVLSASLPVKSQRRKTPRTAQGFTLVSMIVTIVILATLAVIASAHYTSFSADARTAALKSVAGNIASTAEMTHAEMVMAGLAGWNPKHSELRRAVRGGYFGDDEPGRNPFAFCGHDCYFMMGYPSAGSKTLSSLVDGIGQKDDIVFAGWGNNDRQAQGVTGTSVLLALFSFRDNVNINKSNPGNNTLKKHSCYIWYAGSRPGRSYKLGVSPCK